jgi:hypothetical protein
MSRQPRNCDGPAGEHVTYCWQRRTCGKPSCYRCLYQQGHGPYWYAYWSDMLTGRRRSKYIGKERVR